MKVKVNEEIKTLSESVNIDSLKAKFVTEGYELMENGTYTKGENVIDFNVYEGGEMPKAEQERFIKAFKEINDFYEKNGKEPTKNKSNIGEFKLGARLAHMKSDDAYRKGLLKPHDKHNLLESVNESFQNMTDKQIKDLRKNAIDYTNLRIKNWYVNAKADYGVVGKGTAKIDIKNNLFIVNYVENGKKFQWEMAYYDEYAFDNKPDYFFNVWMEQAVSESFTESRKNLNEGMGNELESKYNVGDKVFYLPKLTGMNKKKPLVIERKRWYKEDSIFGEKTEFMWWYAFKGSNLSAREKELTDNVKDVKESIDLNEGYSSDKDSFRESVSRMRRVYDDPKTSKEKKAKIKVWLDGAKKHKKKGFKNESLNEAEKITAELNDGFVLFTDSKGNEEEVDIHTMDDSFKYKGIVFEPDWGDGDESDWKKGVKKLQKDLDKAFKGKYKFVVESLVGEGVTKDDLEKVVDGTVLKLGSHNKFIVKGKDKYGFTGKLENMKGKEISLSATVPFANFSNPHYNKNIEILNESVEDLNEGISYNKVVNANKNATELVMTWLGYSSETEVQYNDEAMAILAQLESTMKASAKSGNNEPVYKILADTWLKGKFFQEDKDIVDRVMRMYVKYHYKK